jgi:hypothetical protein
MVTKEQIQEDVKVEIDESHICRDASITFSHPLMERPVYISVTPYGCLLIHDAKEFFIRKDSIGVIQPITGESGTEYVNFSFKRE